MDFVIHRCVCVCVLGGGGVTYLFSFIISVCVYVLVTQSCPTLCDPMDRSSPGSSVHKSLHARILEWVAIPFSWHHQCRHL